MNTTTFDELREDFREMERQEQERERARLIAKALRDIAELRESLQPYGEDED